MMFKKNSLMEGPDGKLSARQRSIVKRVLDTTNGDLDAAVAVAQTELQKEDLEAENSTSLQEEVSRYTIGGKPYTSIEKDLEDVIDYIDVSQSNIDYAKNGEPLVTFSDICEAVSECFDYSPEETSDAAYAMKQYLEDRGWIVEDSPEEGSRADRMSQIGRSRKKKSLFDLVHESLEEEIIEPRQRKTAISRVRSFTWKNDKNSGFSFPVDENGDIDIDNEDAKRNYEYCLKHPEELLDDGIIENENTYTEPALMKCDKCGEEFYLQDQYMGACECPNCG